MTANTHHHPDTNVGRPRVGLEIADSATRLTVTLGAAAGARRWHARLPTPPEPAEALAAIDALIARALTDAAASPTASGAASSTHADALSATGAADARIPQLTQPDDTPTNPPVVPGSPSTPNTSHTSCAIGVAAWAAVDAAHGQIAGTFGARLASGWEGFPLGERLAARWGGPVCIETATNAAALAEARLGAGRGYDGVLYTLLGRSVTSALVIGGRLWRGASGRAGALGHWLAYPETAGASESGQAPRCVCGARGHLDPIASAQSLTRNMIGRASDDDASHAAMLRISGRRAEAMTAPQVVELAAQGDPAAISVLDDAIEPVAVALANLVAVLDPGVIVIGGPLAEAGHRFYAPLRARVGAICAPYRMDATPTPIVAGALEPFAALRGAALLASLE